MTTATDDEVKLLRLVARFALHLLYRHQHDLGALTHSAEFCNLWELCMEGLGQHDDHPQVPLAEIVAYVERQLASSGVAPR